MNTAILEHGPDSALDLTPLESTGGMSANLILSMNDISSFILFFLNYKNSSQYSIKTLNIISKHRVNFILFKIF